MQNILYNYIDTLYENQNNTETKELRGLFSKKDYYEILKDTLQVIEKYPNKDIEFYKEMLLQKSNILEIIKDFVYEKGRTPGLVIQFGTLLNETIVTCGLRQECIYQNNLRIDYPVPMEKSTIFDLASTSKTFTAISILLLAQNGTIFLDDPINKYLPEFVNLNDITIFDLLTFKKPIKTSSRIDNEENSQNAQKLIYTMTKDENPNLSFPYTDMGAIILKLLIEKVTNMSLDSFINEEILKRCKMDNTYLNVPASKTHLVANENYNTIIKSDGSFNINFQNYPGTVHDPKSRALGHSQGYAPGHAGYFSNAKDMSALAKNLINQNILNENYLLLMGQHHTGGKINQLNEYSTMHGTLNYAKQLDTKRLTVQPFLSGKAFLSPGFAGTSLCVDPLNKIYFFIAGNRLHDRIFMIHPNAKNNLITMPNGKMIYSYQNLSKIVSSTYSKDSEIVSKQAAILAIKYQLLEKIFNQKKALTLVKKI